MADKKISELTELGGGTIASGDFFVVVDRSDTTDSTAGTLKKIDADNILEALSTAYTITLLDDANAAAWLTTLGISALGQSLLGDASAADFIATLGLDADLATLGVPASTTISAFMNTVVDDANVAAIAATLGLWQWTYDTPTSLVGGPTELELVTGLSGVTEIDVIFYGASQDDANNPIGVVLGGAGGYDTTNYANNACSHIGTASSEEAKTDAFYVAPTAAFDAAITAHGVMRLTRFSTTENRWYANGYYNQANIAMFANQGILAMTEDCTKVKLVTLNETANFDAGAINIRYR